MQQPDKATPSSKEPTKVVISAEPEVDQEKELKKEDSLMVSTHE